MWQCINVTQLNTVQGQAVNVGLMFRGFLSLHMVLVLGGGEGSREWLLAYRIAICVLMRRTTLVVKKVRIIQNLDHFNITMSNRELDTKIVHMKTKPKKVFILKTFPLEKQLLRGAFKF